MTDRVDLKRQPPKKYIYWLQDLLIPGKKNILQNQLFKSEYLEEYNELNGQKLAIFYTDALNYSTQMLYNQWWDKNGKDKTKVKQQVSYLLRLDEF